MMSPGQMDKQDCWCLFVILILWSVKLYEVWSITIVHRYLSKTRTFL